MVLTLLLLPRWFPSDLTGPSVVLGAVAEQPLAGPGALVQYGVLGIVASCAIFGLVWLVKRDAAQHQEALARERQNVDRLQQRLDDTRAELRAAREAWAAEVREMNRVQVEKVIPALIGATDMTKEAMHLIRDANRGQR